MLCLCCLGFFQISDYSFYLYLCHDNTFSKEAGNDSSSRRIKLYKEVMCVVVPSTLPSRAAFWRPTRKRCGDLGWPLTAKVLLFSLVLAGDGSLLLLLKSSVNRCTSQISGCQLYLANEWVSRPEALSFPVCLLRRKRSACTATVLA